jgi:hypothetical protein
MEWAAVLRGYAQRSNQRLIVCSHEPEHQHFTGLACAACARDALIASTAQKNAIAARNAATPVQIVARAIGLRPRYTGLPMPPPRRPNPRNIVRPWRRPPPPVSPYSFSKLPPTPTPAPAPSGWSRISWYRRFQLVILAIIFGPQLLAALIHMVSNWSPPSSYPADPPAQITPAQPPSTPEPPPAPEPPPPPAPVIVPIGTSYSMAHDDWPDMWRQLDESTSRVEGAAVAMATGNKFAYGRTLAFLHADAKTHPQLDAVARADFEQDFDRFRGELAYPKESDRVALMVKLQEVLKTKDRFDAEAAYEWGWLDLSAGDPYQSRDAFLRAIWADPNHAAAWYGFGVASMGDDDRTVGAMAIAETLFSSSHIAHRERDRYPTELLLRLGIKPERFVLLQARARRLAVAKTGGKLPPDIAALADKPLPPR